MAYIPTTDGVLRPGLPGDAAVYKQVLDNVEGVYLDYAPPIFGPAACSLEVDQDTDQLVAEIDLPDNLDAVRLYCRIRWRGTTGHTATVTFAVDDLSGTIDTDTDTSTTTSYATTTLLVTPSTTTDARLARVYLRTSTTGQVAQIAHIVIGYAPETFPDGVLPSGAAKLIPGEWDDTDDEVPSEIIERAHNNLICITADRPCGLAGGINRVSAGGVASSGPVYEVRQASSPVPGSDWQLMDRWLQPASDVGLRWYRLSVRISDGSDPSAETRMQIGSYQWVAAGLGWHTTVVELSLAEAVPCSIYLRSPATGDCDLSTWQVMRAAPPVEHPEVTAAYFSDGAGYLACDAFSFLFASGAFVGCTLSFWVRTTETDAYLVDAGMIGGPRFSVQLDGGTAFASMASDGNADYADEYGGPVADDDWHHVFVMTRNESAFSPPGLHVFVDGVSGDDGTGGVTGTFANEPEWRLLRNFENDDEVEAFISNIAIFPFVRPYPEHYLLAASLYAAGRHHNPRNPTGRWRGGRAAGQWIDPIDDNGLLHNRGFAPDGTFYQGGSSDVINVTGDE